MPAPPPNPPKYWREFESSTLQTTALYELPTMIHLVLHFIKFPST